MEAKDRKYGNSIEKALALFDTLEEWADYISFLSRLHKALQQAHTKNYIPHDMAISIKLSKCLSQNLPSGVHSKTLELYMFIFNELGPEKLAANVTVWIPGLLPIMQYSSISIRPFLLQIYQKFILTLPSATLKNLIKPLLTYLLPSLDDERSEFFDQMLKLIDDLKERLHDDPLFWQSLFMVIIRGDERRLGGLVWCGKRLPNLNLHIDEKKIHATTVDQAKNDTVAVVHNSDTSEENADQSKDNTAVIVKNSETNSEEKNSEITETLSEEQQAIIQPEPGLLVRTFITSLQSSNILVQRGYFDLLIAKLPLSSSILQKNKQDLQMLIMSVISGLLKKDMSINRRIWNWLLGDSHEYFKDFGCDLLVSGLLNLLKKDKIKCFKLLLASMDRWEIGSLLIPELFEPVLESIKNSTGHDDYDEVLKSGSALFDSVETSVIFSTVFQLIQERNIEFVRFIIQHFNVHEEEMIIHQWPFMLITLLIKTDHSKQWHELVNELLQIIPARAYLPIEHSSLDMITNDEIMEKISCYYSQERENELPFKSVDISFITLSIAMKLSTSDISYVPCLSSIIDLIPELRFFDVSIVRLIQQNRSSDHVVELSKLFTRIHFKSPLQKVEILHDLIAQLCHSLLIDHEQLDIVKSLHTLTLSLSPYYVEAGITSYLMTLSFTDRLKVVRDLWIHSTDHILLQQPLHILLDELDSQALLLKQWESDIINNGSFNTLFRLITNKLDETMNDDALFTYHVSTINNVLSMDKRLLNLFKEEFTVINSVEYKDEDVSTYKQFTLFQLNKWLSLRSFTPLSLSPVLQLYESLIDSYEDHISIMFDTCLEFINDEPIAMICLTHLAKLIKDHKSLIDKSFMLKTLQDISCTTVLTSWFELLNNSLNYEDDSVYLFISPIISTILEKVNKSGQVGGNTELLCLLLTELQQILTVFHTFIISLEVNNSSMEPGFFSSVTGGVFGNDSRSPSNSEPRRLLQESIEAAVKTGFNTWKNSDLSLKSETSHTVKYGMLKLKHKSKSLMEKLYRLQPFEVLSTLVHQEDGLVYKLLHILDNSRPQLTFPLILQLVYLEPETIKFLSQYVESLEDDSMEDIFGDCLQFLKSVIDGMSSYKSMMVTIIQLINTLSIKLSHSKFGTQRKVKKELNDVFIKLYPTWLTMVGSEGFLECVELVVKNLKNIILETDKQHSFVSTVLNTFKNKSPDYVNSSELSLLNTLITHYPTSKSLRLLIEQFFNDPQFFNVSDAIAWNVVMSQWCTSDKILELLAKTTQSTTNLFNWNEDDEHFHKSQLLRRIGYLLLVSPNDEHISILSTVFMKIGSLSAKYGEKFLLMRIVVMKHSEIHLYNYWTDIYTSLQSLFGKLLKEEPVPLDVVLQSCKLLDLLLVLKIEEFQEWIFVNDTINAVFHQAPVVQQIDLLSRHSYDTTKSLSLAKSGLLLKGVKNIESVDELGGFFSTLSYYHYEDCYNMGEEDSEGCEGDVFGDLFLEL